MVLTALFMPVAHCCQTRPTLCSRPLHISFPNTLTYMCMHAHAHTHTGTNTFICTHTHHHTYACTHICTCIHINADTCLLPPPVPCLGVDIQLPPYFSPTTLESLYLLYPTSNQALSQSPSPSPVSLPLAEALAVTRLDSHSDLLCLTSFALKSILQQNMPKTQTYSLYQRKCGNISW